MTRIAIIGAGMAGLTLAHHLPDEYDVTLFEKSRGVSGRMSTRYADPYQFDHAAQYFTVRSKEFQQFLRPLIEKGLVEEWNGKIMTLAKGETPYKRDWFEPHYVASPKMNDLCKYLAAPCDIHIQTEITRLEYNGSTWSLLSKSGDTFEEFDWVVSTAPAPQTVHLFPDHFSGMDAAKQVKMVGCFSLMLGFTEPLNLSFDAAKVKDSPIGWISVNSARPSRKTGYSLLIQSTHEWAEAHIDDDVKGSEALLLDELSELLNIDAHSAAHISTHRWRYADTPIPAGEDFLLDGQLRLAACGDWCIAGRIEAAFLSGYRLAQQF